MLTFRSKQIWHLSLLLLVLVGLTGTRTPQVRSSAAPLDAAAANAPQALELELVQFAGGLSQPLSIAHAGDARLFVIEKAGRIRIVRPNGTVDPVPYLDITARVGDSSGEMGLLGLAFHPDYASNGYFYVNYTTTVDDPRRTRISRFTVSASPDVADPASEDVLLTVDQPASNHNAGDIHFGPDGFLYIPLGDGGADRGTAQDMGTVLGKILRLDVDTASGNADCYGSGTGHYTVPASNPYLDGAGNSCDEIWAVGFRNPWRSSFDRATGDFYLGDVGDGSYEEIDLQPVSSLGGENYGWPCYEGNHVTSWPGCGPSAHTLPIFEYTHSDGCAVTGGYVYRGSAYPPLVGRYLLADYCTGYLWDLAPTDSGWQATKHTNEGSFGLVAFGEDVAGELYVANISQGIVYHLQQWPRVHLPVVLKQY